MISPNRSILVIILLLSTVVLNAQDAPVEIPQPRRMEEFKFSTQGYAKMMLDGFFVELSNNPANQGHIIIYPKTERQQRTIEKIITSQIKFRSYDPSRITLVRGPKHADGVIQFWSVPPGADAPKPVWGNEMPRGLR